MLVQDFDRQVETLVRKDYPALLGATPEVFRESVAHLRDKVEGSARPENAAAEGHLPFVIVINHQRAGGEHTMPLVERDGKQGLISMAPMMSESFKPIDGVCLPNGTTYLLMDIDRGEATRSVTPNEALEAIRQAGRSPLTIAEGIAILTHYPEFLQKNHCFSLLASRCGDRRVPALWLSEGRPKLGWCWAGNPHTWLGSASCGSRISLP